MPIKIIEKGIEGDFLFARLNNGRIFYARNVFTDADSFERQIYMMYASSNYDIDREIPSEYLGYLKGANNLDKILTLNVDEEIKKRLLRIFPIKEGEVVVEPGPYYGFSTIRLSEMVGDSGLVVAIEADWENYEILLKNLHANDIKNVVPVNEGVWNKIESLPFYSAGGRHKSFVPFNLGTCIEMGNFIVTDTLDNILQRYIVPYRRVNTVVMDINGAESSVLEGMPRLLNKDKLKLIINCYYDKVTISVKEYLENKGFIVYTGIQNRVYAVKG